MIKDEIFKIMPIIYTTIAFIPLAANGIIWIGIDTIAAYFMIWTGACLCGIGRLFLTVGLMRVMRAWRGHMKGIEKESKLRHTIRYLEGRDMEAPKPSGNTPPTGGSTVVY